jgi:hypothetical protein
METICPNSRFIVHVPESLINSNSPMSELTCYRQPKSGSVNISRFVNTQLSN